MNIPVAEGFIFEKTHDFSDNVFTVYLMKNRQQLGELRCYEVKDRIYWKWTQTYPAELKEYAGINFPSADIAANFLNSLWTRSEEYRNNHPLPQDVIGYLERRSENLRTEERELLNKFLDLKREQYQLLKFAEANRIERVKYNTEFSDQEKLIRDLYEFKISLREEEDEEGKYKYREVPFFSEAALYQLIGKEDARSVLIRLERLCESVAPNIV